MRTINYGSNGSFTTVSQDVASGCKVCSLKKRRRTSSDQWPLSELSWEASKRRGHELRREFEKLCANLGEDEVDAAGYLFTFLQPTNSAKQKLIKQIWRNDEEDKEDSVYNREEDHSLVGAKGSSFIFCRLGRMKPLSVYHGDLLP